MFSKNFKSLRFMLLIFLVTTFLMNYVLINAYIPSGSMENTIMTGDRVIGLRFIRHYNRGDIVIFPDPDGGGYYLIKRIIGLPGDTVTIQGGTVSINGTPLEEPYLKETMILSILVDTFSSRILNPMLLPSGKRNIVVF